MYLSHIRVVMQFYPSAYLVNCYNGAYRVVVLVEDPAPHSTILGSGDCAMAAWESAAEHCKRQLPVAQS